MALRDTIRETAHDLEVNREAAACRLTECTAAHEQARNAVLAAEKTLERAVFDEREAGRKQRELHQHLQSRRDMPSALWKKLDELNAVFAQSSKDTYEARELLTQRKSELARAEGAVVFAEAKLKQISKECLEISAQLLLVE